MSWQDVTFKIDDPSDGKRYRFNLTISAYGKSRLYENLDDDSTRWKRFYCWIRRKLGR